MSQNQHTSSTIDNIIKVITALIAVLGFIWGIYQFNAQQNANARAEFNRQMFSNSLDSYSKMTQIVGKMTTLEIPKDTIKYDSLKAAFDERYWGSLLLVEEENVRKALAGLKGEIVDVRNGNGKIENIALRQDYLAEQFRIALRKYKESD